MDKTPRNVLCIFALLQLIAGCSKAVKGLDPVGDGAASALHEERFLRRLYLDLTGAGPTADQLAAGAQSLAAAHDSAAARTALALEVMQSPGFGANYVAELTNRVLAGEQLTARYDLICVTYRNFVPACQACAMPADGQDYCNHCDCAEVKQLYAEELQLMNAAADLTAGAATGEVERRFGGSYLMQYSYADGEALADGLFTSFVGKKPSLDEKRNAGMIASAQPGSGNHGLVFHRLGGSFADLVDIVFTSEPYREAAVDAVFVRYLGRSPTPVERAFFVGKLDPQRPDLRPVIQAVVASTEYFAQ